MKFIIILVIVLVIVVLGQLMKISEFSQKLRGKNEADLTEGETKFNAILFGLFYIALMISSTYLFIVYGAKPGLGESASVHGEAVDFLFTVNWWLLIPVYYLTQTILFFFVIKYRFDKDRTATFFSHSNKLELIWSIVPSAALAGIIIFGLVEWNKITAPPKNAKVIEIYAKQFDWTARYAGKDKKLGQSDFKLISSLNPLGIVTTGLIDSRQAEWTIESFNLGAKSGMFDAHTKFERFKRESISIKDSALNFYKKNKHIKIKKAKLIKESTGDEFWNNIKTLINEKENDLISDESISKMKSRVNKLKRQIKRLEPLKAIQKAENADLDGLDDVIVKELYLIKGQTYEFKFRARESIHSAYFPHFRAQMNCVPGMTTRFSFTPSITTADKRKEDVIVKNYAKLNKDRLAKGMETEEFDYILLCNKICGGSHYKMKMIITVVENQAEFDAWYNKQIEGENGKTFKNLMKLK